MNSRLWFALVGVAIVGGGLVFCGGSSAQEPAEPAVRTWMAGVDATVYSDYVWRGVNKYGTSVSPAVYVRFPSFLVKALGIAETSSDGGMGEVDASFEYFFSKGDLDFGVGGTFYAYDEAPYSDTAEIFGKASWNSGTPITPSLGLYWDFDEAEALYGQLGIAYADRIENVSFRLQATLGAATDGFSETYFFVSESGLIDFEISFAMVIPVSDYFSFEPFAGYSILLDSSIKDFVEDDSHEYIGASIHLQF